MGWFKQSNKNKVAKQVSVKGGKVINEDNQAEMTSTFESYQESPSIYEIMDTIKQRTHQIIEDRAKRGCFCDPLFRCTCGKVK